MNKEKIRVSVRDSFWFLPALYGVLSILSVSVTSVLDFWIVPQVKESLPKFFLTEKSVAQTLYGSLITSILTMTTISFSTIMVVLTTYTTQFSPRTLQDFMKSRVTQHVLGVYSFGFIFALINLLLLGSDQSGLVTPTLTVIVSIICLAFFIIFIHHSSRFVQVNNLIGQIRKSTSTVIERTFEQKNYNEAVEWDQEEINRLKQSDLNEVKADQSGYLQGIQFKPFIEWAKNQNIIMEANFNIGDYVQKGMPIFYYWHFDKEKEINPEECVQYILIGNERTDIQDIEFSIQKLVEISVKAISPGINDPHTAVNCINRIGSLLAELAAVYQPLKYYSDDEENLRLIMEPRTLQDYLYKSFYQIRIYGYHDISVMNGVLEALYKISVVNDKAVKDEVWRFGKYMMNAIDTDELDDLDQKYYKKQARKLAAACDQPI
ncbi:DUF2254 domain-containing protein [Halobacillus mangrovi]|uniref:DUF2254 domain-containing protein n=1 Tax=Halobacillus mangrovi TaxID=402384 RepID=A0A1W6A011_9BACI|nr:DUF2254 domain-containing protein [Halobacillus mangrovi]ARI78873.1 hypothetical protein HM131_19495 [Halobacillus mangrovi]